MRRARLIANRRDEFSKRTKAQAFLRADGRCEHGRGEYEDGCRCNAKLGPGNVFYDHVIAASNGGGNDLGNCAVLCKTHHSEKTEKLDIPRAAKTERMRRKHVAAIR
jgi:5-methylcytosine-specific restriction endonuclease McrA